MPTVVPCGERSIEVMCEATTSCWNRTEQGGLLKFLVVPDEHTGEAYGIEVGRSCTG